MAAALSSEEVAELEPVGLPHALQLGQELVREILARRLGLLAIAVRRLRVVVRWFVRVEDLLHVAAPLRLVCMALNHTQEQQFLSRFLQGRRHSPDYSCAEWPTAT